MTTEHNNEPMGALIMEGLPVAAAIGVFGVIYGATATAVMSPAKTMASSILMFSGAGQFTMVGLLDSGATTAGLVVAVATLGLRHVPLAAVVLPRLPRSRLSRAGLAMVLVDETAGLAVASPRPARRTMLVVGLLAGGAWVVGTMAGVLGADLLGLADLASVVFVILFVGLSAMTCRTGGDVGRAVVTAGVTIAVLLLIPQAGSLGAIAVAGLAAVTTLTPVGKPEMTGSTS